MLPVHATPPCGLAHRDPVGSPIASATKARRIHQGFQQHGTAPVVLLPVSRHLPCTQRQDLAGESFDVHPRQNQKSTVVDDLLQVAAVAVPRSSRSTHPGPASSRPASSRADRPVPDRDNAPSSAGSRRTARDTRDSGNDPSSRANGGCRLRLPRGPSPAACIRSRCLRRRWALRRPREAWPPRTFPAQFSKGGECQEFFGLELLQQLSAFMVLQPSTRPPPFE